jgi:hypothetical protein
MIDFIKELSAGHIGMKNSGNIFKAGEITLG